MKKICLLPLLGMLLLQSCQYHAEVKAEKKAKLQKRDDASAYNIQLGMGYLKQGDTPRAKRKFLAALELSPDSADVVAAMAYYLEKTGDTAEAGKYYRKALSMAPESGSQLNNYGTFLCRTGKYKEADAYFLKAVKDVHYVNSAAAYENAGLCATAIPDYKKAVSYFSKALEQDGRLRQSLYELTAIELKQNQEEMALNYLQKYPQLVLNDSALLTMAVDAAHITGKTGLEEGYRMHLISLNNITGDTGEINEHDTNNG